MQNPNFENSLIIHDIVGTLTDLCSIQPDTDEVKCKAAAKVAQDIDITRVIGKTNIQRAITPQTDSDEELKELLIPCLAFFTYYRLLVMFQGTLADGGYMVESGENSVDITKTVANQHYTVAETYLKIVINFLDLEKPAAPINKATLTPGIRVFGGNEFRT